MEPITIGMQAGADRARWLRLAYALAWVTVLYNIAEGLVSVWFGFEDETVALFGFGLDSFVEVISGAGILHMVTRIRSGHATDRPDRFEARALRITGSAFYLLAAGLAITVGLNTALGHKPETTLWGIVVGSVSILSMWALIHYKMKAGRALRSDAIIADAACTRACLYLSVALLAASLGYELTGIGWLDSAGAAYIAYFSVKEGREAFDKAAGKACSCGGASRAS